MSEVTNRGLRVVVHSAPGEELKGNPWIMDSWSRSLASALSRVHGVEVQPRGVRDGVLSELSRSLVVWATNPDIPEQVFGWIAGRLGNPAGLLPTVPVGPCLTGVEMARFRPILPNGLGWLPWAFVKQVFRGAGLEECLLTRLCNELKEARDAIGEK